jgi:glycosyltransferase involved in cell wall biosynthesis
VPRVSVVLTSYNHADFLRASIESALAQSFGDFELLILDDASGDASWEIIQEYRDPRIVALRSERNERFRGMNQVIRRARGEYVAVHHSDDVWGPRKLERQVAFLDAHPDHAAAFTWVEVIDEGGRPLADRESFYFRIFEQPNRTRREWLRFFFQEGNALCHSSSLVRTRCHEDCGLYDERFGQLYDLHKWIRLCLRHEIHVLPEKLMQYRVYPGERKASGDRPPVRIRSCFESLQLLENYRALRDPAELLAVFPEAGRYARDGELVSEYALAMLCLDPARPPYHRLFGLSLLFELLGDPVEAARLQRVHGFDHMALLAETGKHDVFGLFPARVPELQRDLASAGVQLEAMGSQLSEISGRLEAMERSASWRATRPMRSLARWLGRARKHG